MSRTVLAVVFLHHSDRALADFRGTYGPPRLQKVSRIQRDLSAQTYPTFLRAIGQDREPHILVLIRGTIGISGAYLQIPGAELPAAGFGKPDTFTFLGFTSICSKSHQGRFQVRRKSRGDRMKATPKVVKDGLRRRMHQPVPVQERWLKQVVMGYFNYYAVPTNSGALAAFRAHVVDLWRCMLRRRS